jgi:DNA (cytosine-5)-methyltransferase 1
VTTKPRLLDLYCGAGGAAVGYHRAGFAVVGVDIDDQPNYPFELHQGDAIEYLEVHGREFDAIHASPPCQFATAYRRRKGVAVDAVNLIPDTRDALRRVGGLYVIENVEQAQAHLIEPVMCCGTALGVDIRRHRMFESNAPLAGIACDHAGQAARSPGYPQATNRANRRSTIEVGARRIPLATQQQHMGIDWMTLTELSQAIPPAYTEHIGTQLLARLAEPLFLSSSPTMAAALEQVFGEEG